MYIERHRTDKAISGGHFGGSALNSDDENEDNGPISITPIPGSISIGTSERSPDNDDQKLPINRWRPYAFLLFSNFINEVYQDVPFDFGKNN